MPAKSKYVFITGGVISGLGKGITLASLGRLLKARGYKVVTQKFEPYINVDPGNLSPYQHGEVFVTEDGAETDQDLGHYERFIDEALSRNNSITSGQIFSNVIEKERAGGYNGETVQVIPHITDEIIKHISRAARTADFVITEIGGTVGDIESLPVLEAIRQIAHKKGRENVVFIHTTLVPHLDFIGEMTTKPSQHSVKELSSLGIQPDIIVCRSDRRIPKPVRRKLAMFCNVEENAVIQNLNAESLYEIPLLLEREGLANVVCEKLKLPERKPHLEEWQQLVERQKQLTKSVTIGLVGGYTGLQDAYLSVKEALIHAGIEQNREIKIEWLFAKYLARDGEKSLANLDGIVLAQFAGEDYSEGTLLAAQYARTNNLPFLALGSGLHSAVAEFAKNVLELPGDKLGDIVSYISPEADKTDRAAWLMGAQSAEIKRRTKLHKIYDTSHIKERYRNNKTINIEYRDALEEAGFIISAPRDKSSVAAMEIRGHPFYLAVQCHPEYASRINKPRPLFSAFVEAAKNFQNKPTV